MMPRRPATPRPRLLAGVLGLVVLGCAGMLRVPLDVPPGQHVVLGRLDLSGFEMTEGTLDIVKDDGSFEETVHASLGQRDFAIALPPGRYRVVRLRAFHDGRSFPKEPVWELRLAFEVESEPAVYIGTLQLTSRLGHGLGIRVLDEYDDTLRVLRARYPDLPGAVARSLLRPG